MTELIAFWAGFLFGCFVVSLFAVRSFGRGEADGYASGYAAGREAEIAEHWKRYASDRTEVMRKLDLNSLYGKGAK